MDDKDTILHDHCRGYLPHIENKQYQMITFRLYDSVPKEVVEGWKETLSLLGSLTSSQREPRRHSFSTYKTEADRLLALLDKYEDAGYGSCVLKNDNVAKIVHDAIFFYHGKKYNEAAKQVDRATLYDPAEAVALVKKTATAKFDETVELHVRLGVDPRKANQMVRGIVTLPHGTGTVVRVLALVTPDKEEEAKAAGAEYVGLDDYIQQIKNFFII